MWDLVRNPEDRFSHNEAHVQKPNEYHNLGFRAEIKRIMLTCPCNINPLTPHFHILKMGRTEVYIFSSFFFFFFFFAEKHKLLVLNRTALPTIYVLSKNKRNYRIFHLKIMIL